MRRFPAALIVLVVSLFPNSISWAEITVGKSAPSNLRVSIEQIDHTVWDALLRKYCDASGYVDYQGWTQSKLDRQSLDQYLAHLSRADPNKPASSSSQLAFWINAYNAVTIEGILREYPTTSIRNHTAKFIGYNIWDDLLLHVGDRTYSLNQIEHEVLRKMGEPRIHFAIVCASIGCPPLLNQAYASDSVADQLVFNAKRFFANQQNFRYEIATNSIELSSILKWFAEDFGSTQVEQLRAIAPYLPNTKAQALARSGRASVSYLSYDWNLNDQATRVARGQ